MGGAGTPKRLPACEALYLHMRRECGLIGGRTLSSLTILHVEVSAAESTALGSAAVHRRNGNASPLPFTVSGLDVSLAWCVALVAVAGALMGSTPPGFCRSAAKGCLLPPGHMSHYVSIAVGAKLRCAS